MIEIRERLNKGSKCDFRPVTNHWLASALMSFNHAKILSTETELCYNIPWIYGSVLLAS